MTTILPPTLPAILPPFLVVSLNPTLQKTMVFDNFTTGEVNRAVKIRTDASGKGVNITRVLHQLDQDVLHLTHVGGAGTEQFLSLCAQDTLNLQTVAGGTKIRICTTIIDRGRNQTTELIEPGCSVEPSCEQEVLEHFYRLLPSFGTLIVSGSTAPGYHSDLFARMTADARRHNLSVLLDIRGPMLKEVLTGSRKMLPHILKINLQELSETFFPANEGTLPEHSVNPEILSAAADVMKTLGSRGIVPIITRGRRAVLSLSEEGNVCASEPQKITAYNTIGCGDAFTAGLVAGLSKKPDLEQALHTAHDIAARNAAQLKPGTIVQEELDQLESSAYIP
ncbi:MAG: 1-phosphofructokinase family hexose kinase [Salinispira sp.]